MKICIATTAFPRWPRDSRGTFIWGAAQAIAAQGAEVRVIAMHNPGTKTCETLGAIQVIRPRYMWPEKLEILQKEGGGLPAMWRKSPMAWLVFWPFLAAHTLAIGQYAKDCDLIHANWTLSAAACIASRIYHRRPVVVTLHGSDMMQATRLPFVGQITQAVLLQCDRVIAVSHFLADRARALGIPGEKIKVLSDGVDTDTFLPLPGTREPLLLFVGALTETKGIKYLIQALPSILRRLPEYHLALIGEGPQKEELARLADALGMTEHVQFVGTQSPTQVRDWMQRAQLLVLPSLEEGLGVVLLEALACGTPCVATAVGGIPEVILPEVGQLVPPASVPAMAEAITALLTDAERWRALSQNARQYAEQKYSWEAIAHQLIQTYQDLL